MSNRSVRTYALMSNGGDIATIVIPSGAEIIDLAPYGGYPCIYAIVDPDTPKELRRFQMVPTGFTIPEGGVYVGSAQLIRHDMHLDMHFFEIPIPEEEQHGRKE